METSEMRIRKKKKSSGSDFSNAENTFKYAHPKKITLKHHIYCKNEIEIVIIELFRSSLFPLLPSGDKANFAFWIIWSSSVGIEPFGINSFFWTSQLSVPFTERFSPKQDVDNLQLRCGVDGRSRYLTLHRNGTDLVMLVGCSNNTNKPKVMYLSRQISIFASFQPAI